MPVEEERQSWPELVGLESGVKRKIWPGPEGMRIVALAGVPGEAFTPKPLTELGASDPYTPAAA